MKYNILTRLFAKYLQRVTIENKAACKLALVNNNNSHRSKIKSPESGKLSLAKISRLRR